MVPALVMMRTMNCGRNIAPPGQALRATPATNSMRFMISRLELLRRRAPDPVFCCKCKSFGGGASRSKTHSLMILTPTMKMTTGCQWWRPRVARCELAPRCGHQLQHRHLQRLRKSQPRLTQPLSSLRWSNDSLSFPLDRSFMALGTASLAPGFGALWAAITAQNVATATFALWQS